MINLQAVHRSLHINSPELPTPEEEKKIAEMIEADIDFSIEQKHTHEVDLTLSSEEEI